MTAETDDMRASLIAAVQAELDRYGATMMAEVERLRSSSAADRETMRQAFGEQLQSLAAAVEQSHTRKTSPDPRCRRSATIRTASSAGSKRSTRTCAGSTSRPPGWSPTSTR